MTSFEARCQREDEEDRLELIDPTGHFTSPRSYAATKARRLEELDVLAGPVTIADHGKTIEAGGISFTIEVPASARARAVDPTRGA
jgi:hypothetical protein